MIPAILATLAITTLSAVQYLWGLSYAKAVVLDRTDNLAVQLAAISQAAYAASLMASGEGEICQREETP